MVTDADLQPPVPAYLQYMLVCYSLGLVSYLTLHLTEQDFTAVLNELWGIRYKWFYMRTEPDFLKAELDRI